MLLFRGPSDGHGLGSWDWGRHGDGENIEESERKFMVYCNHFKAVLWRQSQFMSPPPPPPDFFSPPPPGKISHLRRLRLRSPAWMIIDSSNNSTPMIRKSVTNHILVSNLTKMNFKVFLFRMKVRRRRRKFFFCLRLQAKSPASASTALLVNITLRRGTLFQIQSAHFLFLAD